MEWARSRLHLTAVAWLRQLVIAGALVSLEACSLGQAPTGETSASPVLTIDVVAVDLAFAPDTIRLPSGAPVGITLDNRDPGILHNVAVLTVDGTVVFRGSTFAGIETRTYRVAPLSEGSYRFVCDVHPTMTGWLTVERAP